MSSAFSRRRQQLLQLSWPHRPRSIRELEKGNKVASGSALIPDPEEMLIDLAFLQWITYVHIHFDVTKGFSCSG